MHVLAINITKSVSLTQSGEIFESISTPFSVPLGGVLLDMVMTLRVLRLLKVLSSVPQLRHIIGTLIRIIPSMGSYAALYLLLCYRYKLRCYRYKSRCCMYNLRCNRYKSRCNRYESRCNMYKSRCNR